MQSGLSVELKLLAASWPIMDSKIGFPQSSFC